jgi:septal ring factor EnvC (AmiA/AmiB activator)
MGGVLASGAIALEWMTAAVLVAVGVLVGFGLSRLSGSSKRASVVHGFAGLPSVTPDAATDRIQELETKLDGARAAFTEAQRTQAALQTEHNRLNSETAQRASRNIALQAELQRVEADTSRTIRDLQKAVSEQKAALDAALAEAARLKIELTAMQSRAAEVPGLKDQIERLTKA